MKGETKMKPKQTKPLYLALTLLALSMLALSLFAPLCLGSKQKWKWYESKEGGYKVKYPADWEVQVSSRKRPPQIFLAYTYIGKELDLTFQAICSQPPSKKSPYELTIESVEMFKKDFPDYTCLEITNITLDGFPAVKRVDTFTDATESPPLHTKAIWIKSARKGKTYSISFMVNTHDAKKTERYFDEYLPLAEEMIDSFKFI
jgi:hypothetical protein